MIFQDQIGYKLPSIFKITLVVIDCWKMMAPEVHPGLQQISKMESFATIVKDFLLLTIVTKHSILDIQGGPG